MKCPICDSENPSDANACQQCGFGFALTQSFRPDLPLAETSQEPAEPEPAPPPPAQTDGPPVDEPTPPPPPVSTDANALAREHISEGFQAIREQDLERARQEFQQARDLAGDPAIVRLAQTQLDELEPSAPPSTPEPQPASLPEPPAEPAPRPGAVSARATPAPVRTAVQTPAIDRASVVRVGLVLGLVNAVVSGCGTFCCSGLVSSIVFGFVAGWWLLHRAERNQQSASMQQAMLAGGLIGLGGCAGQIIGLFLLYASTPDDAAGVLGLVCSACMIGAFYLLLSTPFAALGWRLKSSQISKQ